MATTLYMNIPCNFENNTLNINCLGFKAKGNSPDEALLECIKNTALYLPLLLSKFKSHTDHRGRTFTSLEVPFNDIILKKINEVEPYPETAKRKSKGLLAEATPEEILKLG